MPRQSIRVEPLTNPRPVKLPAEFGFGRYFTNRMFTQRYTPEKSWHDAVIGAYRPLDLDPAAQVLHSGQNIFEGTKAYLRPDGRVNLFRIDRNMARFNRSARHSCAVGTSVRTRRLRGEPFRFGEKLNAGRK